MSGGGSENVLPYFVFIGPESPNSASIINIVSSATGFPFMTYPNVKSWKEQLMPVNYMAVFVDLKTIIATQGEDRIWFNQVEEVIQVFRVNSFKDQLKITSLFASHSGKEEITAAVTKLVANVKGRGIRKHLRVNRFMRLYIESLTSGDNYLCYSYDISEGGMFITGIGPQPKFKVNESIKIEFIDEPTNPTLAGDIKFILNWEDSKRHPPGVGIYPSKDSLEIMSKVYHGHFHI